MTIIIFVPLKTIQRISVVSYFSQRDHPICSIFKKTFIFPILKIARSRTERRENNEWEIKENKERCIKRTAKKR